MSMCIDCSLMKGDNHIKLRIIVKNLSIIIINWFILLLVFMFTLLFGFYVCDHGQSGEFSILGSEFVIMIDVVVNSLCNNRNVLKYSFGLFVNK